MGRWRRFLTIRRPARERQGRLPFVSRRLRRDRDFKRAILALTAIALAAILGGTAAGRRAVRSLGMRSREVLERAAGVPLDREGTDDRLRRDRARDVARTTEVLDRFYREADPTIRALFDASGMAPGEAVVRWGNYDRVLMLSGRVFAPDDAGRSYRLRPGVRSVWLREITLRGGPPGLFLVPDTSEARDAAAGAGAIVVEESAQTTNSWGCRGPEPDPSAALRVLVVGDSYMQGMFIGDDDTPPAFLARDLRRRVGGTVSVLNTGVLGYSPEQYYAAMMEYADRFRPHLVVAAVFANDFGDAEAVLTRGEGDWREAAYWLGRIAQECRSRAIPLILTPVPPERQVEAVRKEAFYPGRIANLFPGGAATYCNPIEALIDEHLRLKAELRRVGRDRPTSPLYNGHIGDGHFSPAGAAAWGEALGRRVARLLAARGGPSAQPASSSRTASRSGSLTMTNSLVSGKLSSKYHRLHSVQTPSRRSGNPISG